MDLAEWGGGLPVRHGDTVPWASTSVVVVALLFYLKKCVNTQSLRKTSGKVLFRSILVVGVPVHLLLAAVISSYFSRSRLK
jgi:hypothetical protein